MNEFDLHCGPDDVRALLYAVNEAIRLWPGSPARPAEEQETLYRLKMGLFAMSMELVIEERSEGEGPR
jgi:hypothetical protein